MRAWQGGSGQRNRAAGTLVFSRMYACRFGVLHKCTAALSTLPCIGVCRLRACAVQTASPAPQLGACEWRAPPQSSASAAADLIWRALRRSCSMKPANAHPTGGIHSVLGSLRPQWGLGWRVITRLRAQQEGRSLAAVAQPTLASELKARRARIGLCPAHSRATRPPTTRSLVACSAGPATVGRAAPCGRALIGRLAPSRSSLWPERGGRRHGGSNACVPATAGGGPC